MIIAVCIYISWNYFLNFDHHSHIVNGQATKWRFLNCTDSLKYKKMGEYAYMYLSVNNYHFIISRLESTKCHSLYTILLYFLQISN